MQMVEKIKKLIKENGYSVAAFEKQLGFGNGIISKWKTQSPSVDKLKLVADNLNCSVDYLLGRTDSISVDSGEYSNDEMQIIQNYRELSGEGQEYIELQLYIANKVYKQEEMTEPEIISIKYAYMPVSAGTGIDLSEENYKTINIKSNEITRSADFAVKVSGDSMQPTYEDGDILLIESMPCINKGDIGIFVLDGEGFVKEFGGDRLISHNEQYDDIMLSDHDVVMCSGKVIGTLSKQDIV